MKDHPNKTLANLSNFCGSRGQAAGPGRHWAVAGDAGGRVISFAKDPEFD